MNTRSDSYRAAIDKLNGENYQLWQHKVKMLLVKDKAWDVVTKVVKPEEEGKEQND